MTIIYLKKIKIAHLISTFFLLLKGAGGFLFSWFLIHFTGGAEHVNVLKDLSIIMGLSVLLRFGADTAILKLVTNLYDSKRKAEIISLLLSASLLCSFNSIVLFYLVDNFYKFETVSVLQAIFISFLISLNFCLASFLKSFGKINLSFLCDAGMVMIFSLPFIFLLNISPIISLGIIWGIISVIYLAIVIRETFNFVDKSTPETKIEEFSLKKFFYPLPNLFINSIMNYIQQWGIIYFTSLSMTTEYASSFILIIRSSYIFNAVLSPLSSYTVPEVIRIFKYRDHVPVNSYIRKIKPLYRISSVICFLIVAVFSIWSIYPSLIDFPYIASFLFFLFCCSFNLASGPVNIYMAVLGYDSLLVKLRLVTIIPFLISLCFLEGNSFIIACSIYILLQRSCLVYFLKKKSGIILI